MLYRSSYSGTRRLPLDTASDLVSGISNIVVQNTDPLEISRTDMDYTEFKQRLRGILV